MESIVERIREANLLMSQGGPISGIVVAGSAAYKEGYYTSITELRDIDLLFILPKKEHLEVVFGEKLNDLRKAVGISLDECPSSIFQEVLGRGSNPIWEKFDAVRFAGYNSTGGQKVSLKFIDEEFFKTALRESENSIVRVLSHRRVSLLYHHFDEYKLIVTVGSADEELFVSGESLNILQQFLTMRIDNQSIILMGIMTDMLISGQSLYDYNNGIEKIKQLIVEKVSKVNPNNWLSLLYRIAVMPESYLKKLWIQFPQENNVHFLSKVTDRYNFDWSTHLVDIYSPLKSIMTQNLITPKNIFSYLKSSNAELTTFGQLKKKDLKLESIEDKWSFPTVHRYGKAFITSKSSEASKKNYFFFKETTNLFSERRGLLEAQKFFSNVQPTIQCLEGENLCLYDWVIGENLASMRTKLLLETWITTGMWALLNPLNYKDGSPIKDDVEYLTDLEVLRAREIMRVYLTTETNKTVSGVHQVFEDRIEDDRFQFNYRDRIFEIEDRSKRSSASFSIQEIMNFSLVINGKKYESLSTYIKGVKIALSQKSFENDLQTLKLKNAFGLGDSHCGNVMRISEAKSLKADHIYVDYEYAGYHSPFLDICKPFSIDVFFNVYQVESFFSLTGSDELKFPYNVKAHVGQTDSKLPTLFIEHDFYLDWISYFASKVKIQCLLLPLLSSLKNTQQRDRAWEIFRSGVFCSALFSKRYVNKQQFFLILALAVQVIASEDVELKDVLRPMH